VVVFGGTGAGGRIADTWTWDRRGWTLQHPAASPPTRAYAQMAYEGATRTVLLFGGNDGTNDLGDTWSWNGSQWTRLSPAAAPPARQLGGMAYDPLLRRVVLFGGSTSSALAGANDTWSWDGVTWQQLAPKVSPPKRSEITMVYDPAIGRLVFFGGLDFSHSGLFTQDLWTFDGLTWTQITDPGAPAPRAGYGLAYDAALHQLVLTCGSGIGGDLNDTWLWDG